MPDDPMNGTVNQKCLTWALYLFKNTYFDFHAALKKKIPKPTVI